MLGAQRAHGLQECGRGAHQVHVAGHRLDDDRGDLLAVAGKGLAQGIGIVVRQDHGVLDHIFRHAGRGGRVLRGIREGQQARAGLDQQAVGMSVVAALEFHDEVAAGEAAC